MPFFIIFLLIPFVEISVFMAVGEQIGLFTTLTLAFLTAILGGSVIRYQGLQTFMSFQNSMNGGEMPVKEIFDGFCLVAAGALLITPGFVTDFIGFILLIPKVRDVVRSLVAKHISKGSTSSSSSYGFSSQARPADPNIIDGEYEDLSDKKTPPPSPKQIERD